MSVSVVTFPGSNCDADAVHVFRHVLGQETRAVWHRDTVLPPETRLVVLPGGFSYGDALRSGALARFSEVMAAVRRFAEQGGLVLGICNGFQILLESKLLSGAMLQNASRKFVCRQVRLEVTQVDSPFTHQYAKGEVLRIPVAHHEGSYFAEDAALDELDASGQVAFRYLPEDNPNGARRHVAGLFNQQRNVLGMMPHPERAAEPLLGSEDGRRLFESALTWMERVQR